MCKTGTTELHPFDIRKFELYTGRGISAAYNAGGYEGAKACYEAETGSSFEKDLEKARKYYEGKNNKQER